MSWRRFMTAGGTSKVPNATGCGAPKSESESSTALHPPPNPGLELIYCVTLGDWTTAVKAPWGDWYCGYCSAEVNIVETH